MRTKSPIVFACLLAACSSAPPQKPEPQRLRFAVVADSVLLVGERQTQWGIEVWDQGRNQPLFSHESERHFIPASNTKLVVTTTAMALLGPDWRYATTVSLDTVQHTLLIKGSGDPSMSARFFGGDLAVLDSLADSLAVKGVKRIGDVVIDATAFPGEQIHSAWEIGDLPWYYAAPTGAFAVGEAAVRMIVTPNDVRFVGPAPVAQIVRRVRTDTIGARSNIDVDFLAWPDTLVVTGSIAPNGADSSWIAIPEPEDYAARALIDALRRKSITVTGTARVLRDTAQVRALPSTTPLLTWQSPPVKDIVAGLLRPSQNWIAEQLLKTLGSVKGAGGSWRGGLNVERRFLIDVAQIDSSSFSLSDGSGLSAQNVVAPRAFVLLLEYARRQPWGETYRAALPKPGMRGGTLSNRLPGLEDRLSAKTGTIANVNSLSGYVRTAQGRDLTFSIMTNGSGKSSAQIRKAIDVLVQAMAAQTNWE